MIVLQSMDRYDTLATLDPDTGEISWYSRDEKRIKGSVRGSVARLDERTLSLYRRDDELHFRVDDQDFELTEDTQIILENIDEKTNRVQVVQRGDLLFSWLYKPPLIDPPLGTDPTPFVEEEHFDFLLFVHNVTEDRDRKGRIYR